MTTQLKEQPSSFDADSNGWLIKAMVRSELLKLRKRRGLFWTTLTLSVGAVVVYFGVIELMHLISPATHGPAGGATDLSRAVTIMTLIGGTGAILVGATAGAGDASGIFRDLVATGRSRVALFLARIPGAIALYLPMIIVAYAITWLVTVSLAGTNPHATIGTLVQDGVVIVIAAVFNLILSLAVASLTLSMSTTIAILMAWQFIVQNLLINITYFGVYREGLPLSSIGTMLPKARGPVSSVSGESNLVASLVLAVWTIVAIALGAYRTKTVDA